MRISDWSSDVCSSDLRTVLSPYIIALPVQCGGIMRSEQHVQQVAIADHFRVKGDAKSLGMTGCTSADLLISGISLVPANVAAFHRQYAFQRIEHRFSAPEASACQSGNFLDRKSTRLNSSH